MNGKNFNGSKYLSGKIPNKWKFLIEAPFKISSRCCDYLKKIPAKKYEKQTGNYPFVGTNIFESRLRLQLWSKNGCNMFGLKRPISTPLATFTDEDIWRYIKENKVKYSKIYDMGYERTGCMFCMFGCVKNQNKFKTLKITHPKLYAYCMNKLGLRTVLEYVLKNEDNLLFELEE